jgi:23S rRNA (guanosine2251-2'-O)-methyltransferase
MQALLHNVRSAHNVGSIFRTADCFGFSKVWLCGITPAPIDRFGRPVSKIAKVALGAEKSLAWQQAHSTARLIDTLKQQGFTCIALEQSKRAQSLAHFKTSKKLREHMVLVLGPERTGLPPTLLRKCSDILEIPLYGTKESLNVSVAFGIAAYSLTT